MKTALYKNFIYIFISLFLYSCNLNNTNNVIVSSDATIKTFYLNNNTNSPYVSSAVFTITNAYAVDTIFNADSLAYNTKINEIIPSIGFTSGTNGFVINDTLTYGTTSSIKAIDFTKPVKITNVATDGVSKKTYFVKLNVHKIDPYFYTWTKLTENIGADVYENQKALYFNNQLLFFTASGANNYIYTSTEGKVWQKKNVAGLPSGVSYQNNLCVFKNELYLFDGAKIYTSTDGVNWILKKTEIKYSFMGVISEYQGKLYALGKDVLSGIKWVLTSTDGMSWSEMETMRTDFPVSGFAATKFQPRFGNEKMLVVGGYDANGAMLESRYAFDGGSNWVKLQNAKSPFDKTSDAGIAYYGSKVIMVNKYLPKGNFKYVLNSLDEGLSWTMADTTQNRPPVNYNIRIKASVVVNPTTQTMYVIGGMYGVANDDAKIFSDVWQVRVNFYNFKPEEWRKY